MKLIVHIKEGLFNLVSAKLRSLLALLGVLVGTASVVAMVSAGELATNEALKQFKTLGTDLLAVIISEQPSDGKMHMALQTNLTLAQAESIATWDKDILTVAPYTQVYSPIQYEGHDLDGSILGVTNSFAHIVHITLARGRLISSLDKYQNYCVIGHNLYQAMKAISFEDPLGKQIQVGNNIFTVIGVAEPWPENSFVYSNIDNVILVPILSSTTLNKYAVINNIIIQLTPNADIDRVNESIIQYINQYIANKHLYFRSAKELIAKMRKESEIMTVFLGLIGSISLLVGGIGVMNIMLVSVVERRREIGIRLAVGARRSDICFLFLVEAIMLSLLGGTLGVLMGIVIAYLIASFWRWEFILFLLPPLIGFSVSVAIGVFFGFYPAYQASRLNPIDALRVE